MGEHALVARLVHAQQPPRDRRRGGRTSGHASLCIQGAPPQPPVGRLRGPRPMYIPSAELPNGIRRRQAGQNEHSKFSRVKRRDLIGVVVLCGFNLQRASSSGQGFICGALGCWRHVHGKVDCTERRCRQVGDVDILLVQQSGNALFLLVTDLCIKNRE